MQTPRGVAQSGSALGWGPSGRRFKACLPDFRLGVLPTHRAACGDGETMGSSPFREPGERTTPTEGSFGQPLGGREAKRGTLNQAF